MSSYWTRKGWLSPVAFFSPSFPLTVLHSPPQLGLSLVQGQCDGGCWRKTKCMSLSLCLSRHASLYWDLNWQSCGCSLTLLTTSPRSCLLEWLLCSHVAQAASKCYIKSNARATSDSPPLNPNIPLNNGVKVTAHAHFHAWMRTVQTIYTHADGE